MKKLIGIAAAVCVVVIGVKLSSSSPPKRAAVKEQPREAVGEEPRDAERQEEQPSATLAEQLDLILRTEARDESWASETEQTIASLFDDGAISGGALVSQQCGSSLCRIAIKPDGLSPQDLVSKVIHARGPFATGGHYRFDEEAGALMFYVRRKGTPSFGPRRDQAPN